MDEDVSDVILKALTMIFGQSSYSCIINETQHTVENRVYDTSTLIYCNGEQMAFPDICIIRPQVFYNKLFQYSPSIYNRFIILITSTSQ